MQANTDLVGHLRELLHKYHVLVISDQDLEEEPLQQFGGLWGELLTHPGSVNRPNPTVQELANNGKVKGKLLGAWHSDMSWHPTPPKITMLHARTLPKFGGDTGYANQQLAWEHLETASKDTRRSHRRHLVESDALIDLVANHTGKGFGQHVPDSTHPVVRTHDETGKHALYVNPEFTTHIEGYEADQSLLTLFPLWLHATTEEFCLRHRWRQGDLVIWDNRSVMHTAILDYDEPRSMKRVVVQGDVPFH